MPERQAEEENRYRLFWHEVRGRHRDLLQGLGQRPAGRVQPRLAAERRRLGRPDAASSPPTASAPSPTTGAAHGRSGQPWDGNDLDTYADDLAELIETLDLHDVVLVGHSTGGGEVTRYVGRHGTARVAKAVLLGAVPPLMLKTDGQPGGAADRGVRRDPRRRRGRPLAVLPGPQRARSTAPTGRASTVSQGMRDAFWLWACRSASRAPTTASRRSPRPTSPRTSKRIDVPTLILHGDDDQIVPIVAAAAEVREDRQGRHPQGLPRRAARPHRAHEQEFNADLLAFLARPDSRHVRRRPATSRETVETALPRPRAMAVNSTPSAARD